MKLRTGFVSNSSSSSFMVAFKNEPIVKINVDLSKLGEVVSTIDELEREFVKEYGWFDHVTLEDVFTDEEEWSEHPVRRSQYERAVDAIKSGHKIIIGYVTNEGVDDFGVIIYRCGLPTELPEDTFIIQEVER